MRLPTSTTAGVSLALVLSGQLAQALSFDSLSPVPIVKRFIGERAAAAPSSAYEYQGCYAEPSTGRALDKVKSDNAMTYQMCEAICTESKSAYFGIEYGKECWCGNSLNVNANSLPESECTFKCPGDKTQTCGDRKKLSLFKRTGSSVSPESGDRKKVGAFAWQGCYVDDGNPRALTQRTASDTLTPQSCAQQCAGYTYMGLQYGRECWCGNDLAKKAFPIDPAGCNIACAGDKNLRCGAGNRMDLYKAGASVVEYSELASTKMGCFVDAGANGHALSQQYVNDKMTVSMCANWAKQSGLKLFAVKGGRECWAGNAFDTTATKVNSNSCNLACKGDTSQLCGGAKELVVYAFNIEDFPALPKPDPVAIKTADLTLSNAAVSVVKGQQVIAMAPPPGGQASIAIPNTQLTNIPEDVPMALSFSMSAAPVTGLKKRQVETQCTITILLGPMVWMTQQVKSTEGNFLIVQTPAQTGLSQSITIIQVCPDAPLKLNIGGISIGPPAPVQSSSSLPASTSAPQSTSSTVISQSPAESVYTSETISAPSSSSAPQTSSAPSTSSVPQTSSASPSSSQDDGPILPPPETQSIPPAESTWVPSQPPVPTSAPQITDSPNFDQLSTFGAPTYSSGTCSNVWDTNQPNTCYFSQKALATQSAMAVGTDLPTGSLTQSLESCAGICNVFEECQTWAWDGDNQRCIFYSGTFEIYKNQPYVNNQVVYMDKSCYQCGSQTKPSSTSQAPVPTPPPVLDSLSTMGAPSYTSGTCSYRLAAGVSTCYYSGMPSATTGAVAAATFIPDGSLEESLQTCAGICAKLSSCGTFHYDSTLKRCIFYSGVFWNYVNGSYSPKYDSITWMDKSCYDCAVPTRSSIASSSPPPNTPLPEPTTETAATSDAPMTTLPAVLTAQAPTSVAACSEGPGDMCNLSGWATPAATQGLMAVYTGIPSDHQNWLWPESQQHICATLCQERSDCQMYWLDRDDHVKNTGEPWTCYLYDYTIDGTDWIMKTDNTYEDDRYLMNKRDCFVCPVDDKTSTTSDPVTTSMPPTVTAPAVLTTQAPSSASCSSGSPGDLPCTISGFPTPASASGLIAVYTGLPKPPSIWEAKAQEDICASLCAEDNNCQTFALERNDNAPWNCYLYDFNGRDYLLSLSGPFPDDVRKWVWNAKTCFACDALSSDVSSAPSSSILTSMPVASTTPQAILTTQGPTTAAACTLAPAESQACSWSNRVTPTSALLAKYTGIPAAPNGWFDADLQNNICARLCKETDGCGTFALERGGWTDPTPWNCYLFSVDGSWPNMVRVAPYDFSYSNWVQHSKDCFDCPAVDDSAVITSSESETTPTPAPTPISTSMPEMSTASVPTTTAPAILTQKAPASATCDSGPGSPCHNSGWPMPSASSGLLAVYTGIPHGYWWSDPEPQDNICNALCHEQDGCETWALERPSFSHDDTVDHDADWTCYLYNFDTQAYIRGAGKGDEEFDAISWNNKECAVNCRIVEAQSVISSSTPDMTPTPTPSTSFATTPDHSTNSIPTMTAPAILTQKAPASATCNGWGDVGGEIQCLMSGWPTPTSASGLLAVYTGIPAPQVWTEESTRNDLCNALCFEYDGCETWALDRPSYTDDGTDRSGDWSCYLYDFALEPYLKAYGFGSIENARISFNSRLCREGCKLLDPPTSANSTSSTTSADPSTPTSTDFTPSTSAPSITSTPDASLTTAPPYPIISAASTYSACEVPLTGQWWTNACTKSGWPMPTTSIVAIATGVPAVPPGAGSFESRYRQCAAMCAEMTNCGGFALDRGNWPNDMNDWSCNFYGFDVTEFFVGKTYQSDYGRIVWFDNDCFTCDGPKSQSSTLSSFTTLTTSTVGTSTSSTQTSSVSPPNPTATCVSNTSADESLGCSIRGFAPPDTSDVVIENAKSRDECTLMCNADASCQSFMFAREDEFCFMYTKGVWDVLGDITLGGGAYKSNVMDDRACHYCS